MIHYHGTPLTPVADMIKSFAAKHAMVSFEHPEQMDVSAEICQSVVMDNGAFSAWKQNKPYDFTGYVSWVDAWHRHPAVDWHIIPDQIDGDENTNNDLIKNWPFKKCAVPVWHMHESLEKLIWLVNDFERVALGSSGSFAVVGNDPWWNRMAQAMKVACDNNGRPLAKLHGLRMLDPGVFSKLPFASADSCHVARSVGMDVKWKGTYVPKSRAVRAIVLMERVERHASSSHWNEEVISHYQNFDLFG